MPLRLASLAQGRHLHCTFAAAAALIFAAATATAQQTTPAPGDASFGIFLRGTQIGREQVSVATAPSGWIITSSGATQSPLDFTITRFEAKYAPDWQPLELTLEGRLRNTLVSLKTSFALTTAINEITDNNRTVAKEDQISARTVVLPNNVFGAYEALAARLWSTPAGTQLPVYVAPNAEVKLSVRSVTDETLTGPDGSLPTRRFDVLFQNPDRPLNAVVVVDNRLRLVRFELTDVGLLVVREDAASVAVRPTTVRNPTDVDVVIPANGFNLAGTVTTPPAVAARLRHPVAILVGGTTPAGRDEPISGIPVFAQMARGLADAGIMTVRYDRRASGQSGVRIEAATMADYADDVAAVVRWAAKRDDADKRRIVLVGYADGAPSAMLAASKVKEIDGLVTIGASSARGADVLLAQQQHVLDALNLPPEERQARIDLQRRIHAAVIGEGSWDGIPAPVRRQADTPWFRSALLFDPSQVMPKIKKPLLIVHAEQDANVPADEASRLAALANARKKMPPSDVVRVPGITQALVAGGEKSISEKVVSAIAEWVKKL
jgi:uncharacterized protein